MNQSPEHRGALARFQSIARMISLQPVTARDLAARLEVSTKTVERDLDFMRDRLRLEITPTGSGYRLSNKGDLCKCCLGPIEPARRKFSSGQVAC